MDETQGSWTRGSCVPEEGSPFSDGAHGQPAGEAGTGDMWLEGAGYWCSRSFIPEMEGGGERGGVCAGGGSW